MALPLKPLRAALSPSQIACTLPHRRAFSLTAPQRASTSILFALSSLSNSRETSHLNKLSRLPRTEHSPPLKLIETGEVKTHPLPTPSPASKASWSGGEIGRGMRRAQTAAYDARATQIGRAALASHGRQMSRLQRALSESEHRAARLQGLSFQDREKWAREARKLRNEVRVAGVWILGTMAVATGLGMWRFWPQGRAAVVGGEGGDSGVVGREIARRASEGRGVPRGPGVVSGSAAGGMTSSEAARVAAGPAVKAVEVAKEVPTLAVTPTTMPLRTEGARSWWKGWFWKQP